MTTTSRRLRSQVAMAYLVAAAGFVPILVPIWTPETASAQAAERPNLVAIVCDDLAAWAVGAYGNREAVTPNIDRLAAAGARFANAFVATPVCSPSRATYLTGRYAIQHGITDYLASSEQAAGAGLPVGLATWPEVLRKHGYETALIGKWHLGNKPQRAGDVGHPSPARHAAGRRRLLAAAKR